MIRRPAYKSQYDFSYELLGPLFYEFCRRLYVYQQAYPEAIVLFEARGGLRLRYLYEEYLRKNNLTSPLPYKDFYVSRLSIAKACFTSDQEYVTNLFAREYQAGSIGELVAGISRPYELQHQSNSDEKASTESFNKFFSEASSEATSCKKMFEEQKELFSQYLEQLTNGHKQVILVDTGWSGTAQAMLMKSFPEYEFMGFYVGRWDTQKANPWHFPHVVGLLAEAEPFSFRKRYAALFDYHHLIEDPLEPLIQSTEYYQQDSQGKIEPNVELAPDQIAPQEDEEAFRGIVDYILNAPKLSALQSRQIARDRFNKLSWLIRYPRKKDLHAMVLRDRSLDFGKPGTYGILFPQKGTNYRERWHYANISIWKQGKIAEEFGPLAPIFQLLYNHPGLKRRFERVRALPRRIFMWVYVRVMSRLQRLRLWLKRALVGELNHNSKKK